MPSGTMVGFCPVLPERATSGSTALQQQGSVTVKGQADIPGLAATVGMVMSEDCVELAPPLTWASWESWPWGHESRRANLTPT